MKAKVIEFEGTDGAGKTTGLKYFIDQLRAKGLKVLDTREVGCPHLTKCVKLREFVLDPANDLEGESMEFIFAAMRIENQKFYKSVGDDYDLIVSDRGWFSHLAYTDHNVSVEFTEKFYLGIVSELTTLPNAVVHFQVESEVALKRRISRGTTDVIEQKGQAYQDLVRESFTKYLSNQKRSNSLLKDKSLMTSIFYVDANLPIVNVQRSLDSVVDTVCANI